MLKIFIKWLLICFFGSILYTILFVYEINSSKYFHFNFLDSFLTFIYILLLSFIIALPYLFLWRMLNKMSFRGISKYFVYNILLIASLLIVFFISAYIMMSFVDALKLIVSYGIIGAIINLSYLKFGSVPNRAF